MMRQRTTKSKPRKAAGPRNESDTRVLLGHLGDELAELAWEATKHEHCADVEGDTEATCQWRSFADRLSAVAAFAREERELRARR